ncbi:MAG: ubiquitin-like protein Pup [Acidimicrobiia bacterium]
MSDRERAHRRASETTDDAVDATTTNRGEEVAERIDDLLDEIDTVLEENAEEFVKNYVQKGGE